MRDPKLVETLKTLKRAQSSLGKVIEQLESLTALSLQARDINTARRLAGQWVKEQKEGVDPSADELNDETPNQEPMPFVSTMDDLPTFKEAFGSTEIKWSDREGP